MPLQVVLFINSSRFKWIPVDTTAKKQTNFFKIPNNFQQIFQDFRSFHEQFEIPQIFPTIFEDFPNVPQQF